MITLFWVLVALVVYAYLGYPLLIALMALVAGRTTRKDPHHEPTLTMLIPAYNEEDCIAAKLENTLSLDYPHKKLQIIVASESDDGTDTIVEQYAHRGVVLLKSIVRRGKVANLHRAIPEATGDILVFTDANAMFNTDALKMLARNLVDPSVGSVSGRLVYLNRQASASAAGEEAYWGVEGLVKRASSALGSLPGANGSIFALRRELYSPIAERRGDDFELPIRVILQGRRSILEPAAISTEEAATRYADEYRRKVRIINWMFVSALILLKESILRFCPLLAFQLLSHKINRWFVPFWLLALLPVSLFLIQQGSLYRAAFVAQLIVYALAVVGWLAGGRIRLLSLPAYFVVVNTASLVGILTALAGREVSWHKRAGA